MLPLLANAFGVTIDDLMGFKLNSYTNKDRFICGHTPEDGERIIIIDDLIGSGKTIKDRIERLKKLADIKITAIVAIVDNHEENIENCFNGVKLLSDEYGCKILTIVNGDDIAHAIDHGIV